MGDVQCAFNVAEAFDVTNAKAEADMALVICLPVLHEVRNILDIHTSARHLP